MGMFPRTQLREEMPGFLWSDSMAYTQRNIRGLLVQYRGSKVLSTLTWTGAACRPKSSARHSIL